MRKKLIFIFCLLLLSGCKQITEDTNYVAKVNNCLKEDIITNGVGLGYKFYVPKGVKKLKDYDYLSARLYYGVKQDIIPLVVGVKRLGRKRARNIEKIFMAFANDPLVTCGMEDARKLFDEMCENTKKYLTMYNL